MRKLIIHIGSHKTGSSSIQRFLFDKRDELSALHWGYFCRDYSSNKLKVSAYTWMPKSVENGKFTARIVPSFASALAAQKEQNVIVSCEGFSWFQEDELTQFQQQLTQYFDQITIVCYLRRQDKHAISHYQQCSRYLYVPERSFWEDGVKSLPEYRKSFDQYLDYNQRLRCWSKLFGKQNIIIRLFEKNSLISQDVVHDFITSTRLPIIAEKVSSNESMGKEETYISQFLCLNRVDMAKQRFIRKEITSVGKYLPDRDKAMQFYQHYRQSNKLLNEFFTINDNEFLFSDDFSQYPNQDSVLDNPEVINFVDDLVKGIKRIPALSNNDINFIRDCAIELESYDLNKSLALMKLAQRMRPSGSTIKRKIALYQQVLKSDKSLWVMRYLGFFKRLKGELMSQRSKWSTTFNVTKKQAIKISFHHQERQQPLVIAHSIGTLRKAYGGLTKAMFKRANLYAEKGYISRIYTFNYQPDLTTLINFYRQTHVIHQNVHVFNHYQQLFEVADVAYEAFAIQGYSKKLFLEDRCRSIVDERQRQRLIICTNEITFEEKRFWLNDKGLVFLTTINPVDGPEHSFRCGHTGTEYDSKDSYVAAWLNSHLKSAKQVNVFIDEPYTCGIWQKFQHANMRKIAVIHTNHYRNKLNLEGGITPAVKPFVDSIACYNDLIFMTNAQRIDFIKDVNIPKAINCQTIPHAMDDFSVTLEPDNTVVTISRFNQFGKMIDQSITAFAMVADEFPDVQYHLYGSGDKEYEAYCNELIITLNMQDRIIMKGFTNDPIKVFQQALFSLQPTRFEGFGLSMLESLSCSCPVITYDIKYGPNEIIEHGKNGYLCELANVSKMAEYMRKLLSNKTTLHNMRKSASSIHRKFSIERYENSFLSLIK